MIALLILFLGTYMVAAIPSGYWLGLACGKDLLNTGSKSTGATNVLRVVGKWQALAVLIFDVAKGFFPVYYAKNYFFVNNYFENANWLLLVVSFIPILAHSKSIYIGFKGGKSSATGLGILLALNYQVGLLSALIWFTVVKTTKYSSMGSIVGVPLIPVWMYLFGEPLPIVIFGIVAFIYIVLIKHRSNIKRLLDGTEPKVGQKN